MRINRILTPQGVLVKAIQVEERAQLLDEYPEGEPKAWLAVAGATACLFVSFGWMNVIGIFQEYYQSNQVRDYTPLDIAWIPSLQSTSTDHPIGQCLMLSSFLHVCRQNLRWQGL